MSWHFSRALEAAFSEANCSGGEPSVPLKLNPIAVECSCKDKTMECSIHSLYGMTCERLTDIPGVEKWTSSLEASPARTSARLAKGQESKASGLASGEKWQESLARYDPDSHSLKTAQCSLFEDSTESLRILPRWGSMRNGELFRRRTPERLTSGNASGFWPTPRKSEYKGSGPKGCKAQKHMLERNYLCAVVEETCGGQPTRRTWPTPRTMDALNPEGRLKRKVNNNSDFVAAKVAKMGIQGQLNPNWVEWLMGWPIEWTALKPLETDRFRQWWNSHGKF